MFKNLLGMLLISLFIVGCGDNKEDETIKTNEKIAEPLNIEVEENKNARELKVEEKIKVENKQNSYYLDYNVKSEYSQNSQPANKDASIRVKPRTSIDANMHIRSPYEKVKISLLVKKLSKDFITRCSACHNDYANGIIGPSLLDKDSDSIFNSIMKFKKDKSLNVLMTELVNNMNEKEIRKIADEIYEFNKKVRKLK
ncbi:hypothetical protein CP965_02760 [Halarcobacter mediterraneus]|uniref:Cytochrome c domain-containing protein n=1 Tax=Halarcobacter mediterraneus TaxID=2023153 RepID=A0A4V1M1M4_9BACT|nr:hypothetical protein [Halarcobacter mediterraneus]RXK14386.1 hypothetical protein CP965_02760 [Halarcobacter mediterraneus]